MKHIILMATFVALLAAPAWAQWSDDFQSYALGSSLFGQGGWEGWNGSAAGSPADVIVADPDPLATPGNQVVQVNPGNDIAKPHTGYTSGAWVLTGKVFLPSTHSGNGHAWVWMMSNYNVGGDIAYSLGLHFDMTNNVAWHDEAAEGGVPLVYGAWASFRIEIDLEANLCKTFYNGTQVGLGSWYDSGNMPFDAKGIGASELYVDSGDPVYFDDLSLTAGTLTVPPVDPATDITSAAVAKSKYFVGLGQMFGATAEWGIGWPSGVIEITNGGGNQDSWWRMNDGSPRGVMVTFAGTSPDFIGYKFKLPATVTHIVWWNYVFGDGGSFAATPEVQYLDAVGGTWHTLPSVTWDRPYNTAYAFGSPNILSWGARRYVMTINNPPANIWGLRLFGETQPGVDDGTPPAGGANLPGTGFIGVNELALYGTVNTGSVNLANNLALATNGATPVARYCQQGAAGIALINDGLFNASGDSFGNRSPTGEDWIGVTWTTPQNNVTAVGMTFKKFKDGGYLGSTLCGVDASVRIEYTTDANPDPAVATYVPVTGLNLGWYPSVARKLASLQWTESGGRGNWSLGGNTAWMFTFNPVSNVTGIRIIGQPASFVAGDGDGFMAWLEFEVFPSVLLGAQAQAATPRPLQALKSLAGKVFEDLRATAQF